MDLGGNKKLADAYITNNQSESGHGDEYFGIWT